MSTLIIATAWWFLLNVSHSPTPRTDGPRAYGPYPTESMCTVAARYILPRDERLWTQTERDTAAAERKRSADKATATREAEIQAKRVPGTAQRITLSTGETLEFAKNGTSQTVSWLLGSGSFGSYNINGTVSPSYDLIRPCESDPSSEAPRLDGCTLDPDVPGLISCQASGAVTTEPCRQTGMNAGPAFMPFELRDANGHILVDEKGDPIWRQP